jgi:hypothetical protein
MSIRARGALESFERLCSRLETSNKVYFTRFGDGEIIAMMGKHHRNYRSSHAFVRELRESFVIDDPSYLIALSVNMPLESGMTRGVFSPYRQNDNLASFIENENLVSGDGIYESQIMFHYVAVFYPRLMFDFFEKHVRPRRKLFVGCTPQRVAEKLYGPIDIYIPTPARHAFDSIGRWWNEVERGSAEVELVIPSVGAASNVISKRLWHLDRPLHVLDIGSIIDAVEGRRSRTWIKHVGHRIQQVLRPEDRDRSIRFHIGALVKDMRYKVRQLYR